MSGLVYDRRGDGPPLVLVHGIGSRWQVWEPVLDVVAHHYDVVTVDLPGFGASPADPDVAIGVRGYADRIAALCDELGFDRPTVGGNSMGGGIAIELGRRGIASEVVAFSPVGFWNGAERRWCQLSLTAAFRLLGPLRGSLPRVLAHPAGRVVVAGQLIGHPVRLDPATLLADLVAALDAPSFVEALAAFADYDIRDPEQDWGKLRDIPVTIAWGNRDALLIYKTQSARAKRAMPWANHVTLSSAGHVPFHDDPQRCAELLIRG